MLHVVCNSNTLGQVEDVRDGICVDPHLCRGTPHEKYSSCTKGLVRVGETVGRCEKWMNG